MKKTFLILLACLVQPVFANVKLPAIFGNGMVMQRNVKNAVWGWADAGEKVTATWLGKTYTATPGNTGKWMLHLDAAPAGGPHTLTVAGKNQIQFTNVLVGEVWLCSGQSNMEWRMNMLNGKYDADVAASANPNIRLIEISDATSLTPLTDVKTSGWKPANPENTPAFSAVAYFFARELNQKLNVPIGLVSAEWGGTVAQAWTSTDGLRAFPHYLREHEQMKAQAPASNELGKSKPQPMEKLYAEYLKKTDAADAGTGKWMLPTLNTTGWQAMNQPEGWQDTNLKDVDGLVWLRKEITVEKKDAGQDLTLHLNTIDDNDVTYFNGVQVGATDGYNLARKYVVKGKLVKPGRNVIAIRVQDTGGPGGILGKAGDLKAEVNGTAIALAGAWQYKFSAAAKDLPLNPKQDQNSPNHPALLYNAMIAPLVPYGIKGVIWYQGEGNAGQAHEYRQLFPALIADWRNHWQTGEFPFLFVQLANFMATAPQPAESEWAELREAQSMTLGLPITGMACTIDIGEAGDIHPKNKLDVGKRLSYAARKIAYGEDIVHSGPIYLSHTVENNRMRIGFSSIGTGLEAKNGELKGFVIAGEDKKFVWANATIEGNTIVVWNDAVAKPVAVRYAWANNPEGCNLYNKENLPAPPFRTDTWPGITVGK